jgi:hypothetical protein
MFVPHFRVIPRQDVERRDRENDASARPDDSRHLTHGRHVWLHHLQDVERDRQVE